MPTPVRMEVEVDAMEMDVNSIRLNVGITDVPSFLGTLRYIARPRGATVRQFDSPYAIVRTDPDQIKEIADEIDRIYGDHERPSTT